MVDLLLFYAWAVTSVAAGVVVGGAVERRRPSRSFVFTRRFGRQPFNAWWSGVVAAVAWAIFTASLAAW